MSQLIVRTIIEDNFNYYKLEDLFDESEINKYSNWIYSRFNSICKKNMDSKLNSEWIVRHYLATKMILSATVMLSSLEYCLEQNVRISVPYLSYYSILTCCRAVTFTLPDVSWNNGNIIEMKHNKIINEVKNCIMKLNKDYGEKLNEQINEYKDYRELFSYKFPATGTGIMDYEHYSYEKTVDICKILCEIAQLNSYQVEKYVNKNCLQNLEEFKILDKNYLNRCFCYNIDKKILQ
ncbi:hypothetical protein WS9_005850 [Paraclostridium sordellii 8483]|uniref:hypothetical protein n=1 Tax=Paraclostridium sordellii TaxID=1505 RepID=UPI000311A52A|nr:hypothetical protein [Paeniclostridium sordellii]TAN68470.1 hypothetical protein WS9_005850 [Paeniclostridium sordellii 8483]